jgi:hypothetical protein
MFLIIEGKRKGEKKTALEEEKGRGEEGVMLRVCLEEGF